jgi:hypothetical protein
MKSVKNLLLTGLIVLAAVTMGCPTDSDDDSSSPPTGIQLPPIDEDTTGQANISGSDIPLEGYTGGDIASISDTSNGYTFWVINGKLGFTLDTPSYLYPISSFLNGKSGNSNDGAYFNRTNNDYELTFSDGATQVAVIDRFFLGGDGDDAIARYKAETDGKTYELRCQILYIYVDSNCTFSRSVKKTGNDTYDEFSFELKAGWNLVQKNTSAKPGQGNYSWSIATKDVPWSFLPSSN